MAGFFGLFDYSKPGRGVDKNAPEKKRIFFFFELYFRKFWKLVTLNLIFVLFCIPVVTIGPAIAAMSKVLRDFANEKPVFLWSDFVEAFKKNWKQGLIMSIIDAVAFVLIVVSFMFYSHQAATNMIFYIPLFLVVLIAFLGIMLNYYIFLMIPTLDMKLKDMLRNAFLLSILGIKTNLCTLFFTLVFTFACCYFFVFSLLIGIVLYFSTYGFIVVFNSYQYIEKYIIQPYYNQTGERRPDVYYFDEDDEDDVIFEDIGTQEKQVAPSPSVKRGKTIQ